MNLGLIWPEKFSRKPCSISHVRAGVLDRSFSAPQSTPNSCPSTSIFITRRRSEKICHAIVSEIAQEQLEVLLIGLKGKGGYTRPAGDQRVEAIGAHIDEAFRRRQQTL